MKKIYYSLSLIFVTTFLMLPITNGQTAEPSVTQTAESTPKPTVVSAEKKLLNTQIQNLKDKIATKVAEISASSRQVVAGIIESKSEGGFVVNQGSKTVKVTVDAEVTSYENLINSKTSITLKSLEKNDYVVLEGVMLNDEFSTEKVYLQNQYEFLTGQIIGVEKKDYTIEIVTTDQETIVVDIEKSTIQNSIDPKSLKIVTAGFADYKTGSKIQFVVLSRGTEKGKASGVRMLIIPDSLGT